jgi:replicative DNA helicase
MNTQIAEQSVLGGVLITPSRFQDIADKLTPEDFQNEVNRKIWVSFLELDRDNEPMDLVTVMSRVGEGAYLGELHRNTPSSANIEQYVELVKDASLQRQLLIAGSKVIEIAKGEGKAREKIDQAQSELLAIADSKAESGPKHVSEYIPAWLSSVEGRVNRKGDLIGESTGLADLDKLTAGLQPTDLIIVAGRPSMGKELHNDSKVLMVDGIYKRIGDVMVGEEVASVDGNRSNICGVFPQGEKAVYTVKFSDGRTVRAGLEHQWEIMYRDWTEPRVVTTKKLIEMISRKRYKNRIYIETPSGDYGIDYKINIHPYLLGVLLGDGGFSSGGVNISNSSEFIMNSVRRFCGDLSVKKADEKFSDYRICSERGAKNWLIDELKSYGLYGLKSIEKYIPDPYLSASKETRRQIFMGMMDTDGTVEKFGAMTYSTSSERMAGNFLDLARSLGFWAKISSRIPNYSYKGERKPGKRSYKISLWHERSEDFISIKEKRDRLFNKKSNRRKRLSVESIVFTENAECTCISVTHPRELFICDNYIVTHNTTLAMNFAENVAIREGLPALVFSLEMSAEQLINRSVCSLGSVDQEQMRLAELDDSGWGKVTSATGMISKSGLVVDETPGITVLELRARAKRVHRKTPLKLIVVDYIQLMSGKGDNQNNIVSDITRGLKALAKELRVPVVALSQLNRSLEQRQDKRPRMADLRDSGAIEQDADVVAFVYRDEVYNPDTEYKGIAEIIIGKQRNGPIGKVYTCFQGNYCRFKNHIGEVVMQPKREDRWSGGFGG